VFAHRGASGTHPENTLPAFAAGLAAGADRLELDVHATADGHVVVLHDPTLDRTTDASGPVKARTLAEVERADAGFRFRAGDGTHPYRGRGIRVPTLRALLAAHPDVPLNIEVKQADPPIVERVLADLDVFGARVRTLLAAEHHAIMERIRRTAPDVVTSASAAEVAEFVFRVREGRLGGYRPAAVALQVPPSLGDTAIVSSETVAAAHRLGVEIHVWTINDEREMERLLDLGVDGLVSDLPERVVAVCRRRGLRRP
jgi:glycerophosphoryl diester phosphodiesterase